MNPILRNVLAVIAGAFIGSLVNMAIIQVSGSIIPPPEGADLTTPEGLEAAMSIMTPKHFIMPFLAHALGTLVGAYVAAKIAATRKMAIALIIGVFFLIGGITVATMIPAPTWFLALDLIVAYLPFAYLGGKVATR